MEGSIPQLLPTCRIFSFNHHLLPLPFSLPPPSVVVCHAFLPRRSCSCSFARGSRYVALCSANSHAVLTALPQRTLPSPVLLRASTGELDWFDELMAFFYCHRRVQDTTNNITWTYTAGSPNPINIIVFNQNNATLNGNFSIASYVNVSQEVCIPSSRLHDAPRLTSPSLPADFHCVRLVFAALFLVVVG